MATMRRATAVDAPGLYRVCRRTGLAGSDASGRHADPDLLGHVWVGPYLHAPGAVALAVQDEQGVAGYCVAAPDTAAFEDWLEATWWPPLRRRYPLGAGATPDDAALVDRLHDPPRAPESATRRHPAHLHVDLLPRLQGQGWGRRLVETVLDELADAGVPGLHLGVDPSNTGALAFYARLGFAPVPGTDGPLLGVRLPRH